MIRVFLTGLLLIFVLSPTVSVCAGEADGWIPLFNGKNMDGWKEIPPHPGRGRLPNRWVAEDGIMINKNRGCDISGGPNLTDLQLHVEWKLPKRSNSGIYLRGRYEIQIQDDYGKKLGAGSCGGIYGQLTPRVNACYPAGEWQSFDAILRDNRVTVVHNGVHTIMNGPLKSVTGAAMPGKHGDPGPVKIQGDHGPISLRNIQIRPLKKDETPVAFPAKTGFARIFDGKTLAGWSATKTGHGSGGKWEVVDGAIAGGQDPPGNGGVILSKESYGDFELTADVRPDWGCDSGVFLRSTKEGKCYQIMVDYYGGGNVGGIYGEGTGGFNVRNYDFAPDSKKLVVRKEPSEGALPLAPEKADALCFHDDWNHIRCRMTGNPPTIDVWLNGVHILHFTDTEKRLGDTGQIGLQVHGGKGWPMGKKTRFRQIEIKRLN